MQNYYGMAIRQRPGQVYEIIKGVAVVLLHCSTWKVLKLDINFVLKASIVRKTTKVAK